MTDTEHLPHLAPDVFVALAAIGWADGELSADEADGIVRAASECGFSLEEIERIEQATRQRVDLGAVDASNLIGLDRAFVYATAVWLARLDGVVEPTEREALAALADRLRLPGDVRATCSSVALAVAERSGSGVARYDFLGLRKQLFEQLSRRSG
jgi:hypothetical protein